LPTGFVAKIISVCRAFFKLVTI